MRIPSLIVASVAVSFLCGAAAAQPVPHIVEKTLNDMAKDCGADPAARGKALTSIDLNGDGIPDWVLDAGELKCEMASFWCGTGGCTLNIFVSSGADFTLVWEENAHAWKPVKIGGRPGIHFDLHGSACGRVGAAPCSQRYVFQGSRLIKAK